MVSPDTPATTRQFFELSSAGNMHRALLDSVSVLCQVLGESVEVDVCRLSASRIFLLHKTLAATYTPLALRRREKRERGKKWEREVQVWDKGCTCSITVSAFTLTVSYASVIYTFFP